ncbi:serpin [Tyrophagus putrescentiae]|nr:serpin [Tyrophagus putrescentiae]
MSRLTFLLVASLLAACDFLMADEAPGPVLKALHVAQANDDFGLQLLHRLELAEKTERGQKHSLQTPRNLLISPLSLSSVLTMLMAGGRNVTGEEIKNTLGFEKMTEQDVFTGFSHLLQGVKSTSGENNKHITLQMANSIALQNTFRLLPEYERVIRESFGATPFPVDFSRHAHEATASINAWVAQQTHNKVEKLFKEDLDAESVLVLLNALYFKGAWQYRFNASQTVDAPFRYELPNVQALVPTMTLRGTLRYAHFDDGDLVELPYADSSLSMLIYLPDIRWVKDYQTIAGQFERYGGHASVKIAERLSALRNTTVRLHLPRFSITGDYSSLNEPLQNFGHSNCLQQRPRRPQPHQRPPKSLPLKSRS